MESKLDNLDISKMSAETLDQELEKGYSDMQAGRTKPAAQVFADIRNDYAAPDESGSTDL